MQNNFPKMTFTCFSCDKSVEDFDLGATDTAGWNRRDFEDGFGFICSSCQQEEFVAADAEEDSPVVRGGTDPGAIGGAIVNALREAFAAADAEEDAAAEEDDDAGGPTGGDA